MEKIVYGGIKDVSQLNPLQVISTGYYDNNGLKQGSFETHYHNGLLTAKRSFNDDRFTGRLDIYLPSGEPKNDICSGKKFRKNSPSLEPGKKLRTTVTATINIFSGHWFGK